MPTQGLLFIPDISGFTRFVNETEIEHSRLIIQELLEILINSNEIGLEISEVEGDAILFYRYGQPPSLDEVYRQVQKMFCEFHRSLIIYDNTKYCQCAACTSAIRLSLKVITHYGEFTGYNVKQFQKLIGKDVIVAHQLLKNDIDTHEYWLVTQNMLQQESPLKYTEWMQWMKSTKQTEAGEVPFHYTLLSQLKNELSPETIVREDLSRKTKVLSVTEVYETDIITLFHATGDFNNRSKWMHGVRSVEEVSHFLPRVGMKCKSIMEDGTVTTYSSSYYYSTDRIEFTETDENGMTRHFTLIKIDDKKTRFTLDLYIRKGGMGKLFFNLGKKPRIHNELNGSLIKLKEVVREMNSERGN